MSQEIHLIDAFTAEAFGGNPAAVCLMDSYPTDETMQNIAMEMNQAETAFLVQNAPLDYQLRWFTPISEIKLCGHATLASAHMLRECGHAKPGDRIVFRTLSGDLFANVLESGITLDFPALPGKETSPPAALTAGLPSKPLVCENNGPNYLVEIEDYAALLKCAPYAEFKKLEGVGVIVTTNKGVPSGFDFASRYFAPNYGVDEDPVTGSAHCFLAPYWARKLNKTSLRAYQASRRGGVLDIKLEDGRVFMTGNAVTTLKGTLLAPLAQPMPIRKRG